MDNLNNNVVNNLNNNVNNLNNNIITLFNNTKLLLVLKILVIYYIFFISNKLNKELIVLFDKLYFRALILICIFYCLTIDLSLALLLLIAYINSINTLNKLKLNDLLNVNSLDYLSSEEDFE